MRALFFIALPARITVHNRTGVSAFPGFMDIFYNKLIVMSIVFLISNILVGLEIDYTCLGGSWNGKVWEPLF